MTEPDVRARPRRATRPSAEHTEPAPERALSSEAVAVACAGVVLGPLLVVVTGSWFVFAASGALAAASAVALLAAAIDPASGGGPRAGLADLPAWPTVLVMAASIVLAVVEGGRTWAVPAMFVPAACGWLALQGGVADDVPSPARRATPRPAAVGERAAPPVNMGAAYAVLVAVVMVPLLAWLLGLV